MVDTADWAESREACGANLPENAHRPLHPGEIYCPVVPADSKTKEVSTRTLIVGSISSLLFSAAATFIALKLGEGIEPAIPLAILAVGLSLLAKRRSTLLESAHIVVLGATSGIVACGAAFTVPALHVLRVSPGPGLVSTILFPFVGAVLGVLFLVPFRRYFVAEQHGKLSFPEGSAMTETLVAGERGGASAQVLAYSIGLGFVFDFVVATMRIWRETFTTSLIETLYPLTHRWKVVFSMNTSAAILGIGYLVGLRYTAIIVGGSMLSWFVLVPLVAHLSPGMTLNTESGWRSITEMPAEDIFRYLVRDIGIGAICTAGLISILRMLPATGRAIGRSASDLQSRLRRSSRSNPIRTLDGPDRDMATTTVAALAIGSASIVWLGLRFGPLVEHPSANMIATVATAAALIASFLFASVSAWATAMAASTPISGMTLTTIIGAGLVLRALGLSGTTGVVVTVWVASVVCTALSMAASLVSQFKMGYWLGSSPRTIQWTNILGSAMASAAVAITITLLANTYGFVPEAGKEALAAPQPNAVAAVSVSVLTEGGSPWTSYALGGTIAVIIEMLGVSSLAFALGMYIPIDLEVPGLVGALVAHLLGRKQDGAVPDGRDNTAHTRGTLISSGLIAGGALSGVASASIHWLHSATGRRWLPDVSNIGALGNGLGLAAFFGLAGWMYWDARRISCQ